MSGSENVKNRTIPVLIGIIVALIVVVGVGSVLAVKFGLVDFKEGFNFNKSKFLFGLNKVLRKTVVFHSFFELL